MKPVLPEDLRPWLERLRAVPGIKDIRLAQTGRPERADAVLELRTGAKWHPFFLEQKRAPRLNQAILQQIRTWKNVENRHPWMLFAEHVTPEMGRRLEADGIHYLDRQGNCDIRIPEDNFLIHVEGRRPPPTPPGGRGIGAPGYKVLFALLGRDGLVNQTVRTIANVAEVGKTTAAEMLDRLREEGFLLEMRGEKALVRPRELRERWITGYLDTLRPRLLVGIHQMHLDPAETQDRIERHPPFMPWAWGGATAAERMIRYHKGGRVILHTTGVTTEVLRTAQLLPARDGDFIIIAPPCALGLEGTGPHLAHPLLVHAELLAENEERAREAAGMVENQYLEESK